MDPLTEGCQVGVGQKAEGLVPDATLLLYPDGCLG
jgi:hypothetical protein